MQKVKQIFDTILISAFINFYGKEKREYIREKFSDVQIILYDKIPLKEKDNIRNHIVTDISEEKLKEILDSKQQNLFLQSGFIDEFNLLILPQDYNLTHIAHECNHMIASHILSLNPLKSVNGISITLEKNGVITMHEFLNEAIIQLMTIEILNSVGEQAEPSWQETLFPLVNYFYNTFKNELKALFTSGNLSEFINIVGESNFDEFSQSIFIQGFKIRRALGNGNKPKIKDDDIKNVEDIVEKMKNCNNQLSLN